MKLFKITRVIIGISIFLLLAIGSTDSGDTAEKINTDSSKEIKKSDTKKETKSQKSFKIGDKIKFDNVIYTVNSVETSVGSEFNEPMKDKHVFYIVDITVENKSDETVTISSILMFKLVDSQGYNYNITFNTDTRGQVDGEIQSGEKLRGQLSFEVPKNEKKFKLDIDPSIFGSGKFSVDLSNS